MKDKETDIFTQSKKVKFNKRIRFCKKCKKKMSRYNRSIKFCFVCQRDNVRIPLEKKTRRSIGKGWNVK